VDLLQLYLLIWSFLRFLEDSTEAQPLMAVHHPSLVCGQSIKIFVSLSRYLYLFCQITARAILNIYLRHLLINL
jgi:hypothetical protein